MSLEYKEQINELFRAWPCYCNMNQVLKNRYEQYINVTKYNVVKLLYLMLATIA